MPPRASNLISAFPVGDQGQEVVCPLLNQDGSSCRKRCLGEKRYRSMQEHIRRAHPQYYLAKLPATKESFELMINSPPHDPPAQDPNHANHHRARSFQQQQQKLQQEQQQQQQQQQQHHHHQSHSQSPLQQQHHHHTHHQHQHSDPTGLSPRFGIDGGLNSSVDAYHGLGGPHDGHDGGYYPADAEAAVIYNNMQAQQRSSDEYRRGSLIPAASAAAALAQLHYHRAGDDWGGGGGDDGGDGGAGAGPGPDLGQVILPSIQMSPTVTEADFLQNFYASQNADLKHHHHHQQQQQHDAYSVDPTLDDGGAFMHVPGPGGFPVSSSSDRPGLLPSSMGRSSSPDRMLMNERMLTLPPLGGGVGGGGGGPRSSLTRPHSRPRKSSLTQQGRLPKHERKRSKDGVKRSSGDRKAFSAEPSALGALGKRWEDLIDAAASATEEEGSRDLTPIPASPYQSPQVPSRTSLPPLALGSQFQSFQASPLNRALTPPPPDATNLELQPFPSVESSLSSVVSHAHHGSADSSGSQFHIMNPNSLTSPSDSSPVFHHPQLASMSAHHQQQQQPHSGGHHSHHNSLSHTSPSQQQHHPQGLHHPPSSSSSAGPPPPPGLMHHPSSAGLTPTGPAQPGSSHSHSHSNNPPSGLTMPKNLQPDINHLVDHSASAIDAESGLAVGGVGGISETVQIYCAGCRHLAVLREAYACTNCICGLCAECVSALLSGQSKGRLSACPRCGVLESEFKRFDLDLR